MARGSEAVTSPTAIAAGTPEFCRPDTSHAPPVATSSAPSRLPGRRHQATRPLSAKSVASPGKT